MSKRDDEITDSLMEIREFADNHIHPLDDYSLYSQLIDLIDNTISLVEKPIKKSLVVQIPNEYTNINKEAFNEWMSYKKYKNKGAVTKTLNMLNKYDFQTQQQMVDKSIMNEYAGLFPPKQYKSKTDNNIYVGHEWLSENDTQEVLEIGR